jgi:hypothetical protein
MNESSLHGAIKNMYSHDDCTYECTVEGFIVDVSKGDSIIEIQTGNFANIRLKLLSLLSRHRIKLVYPIAVEKTIIVYDRERENILYRRKSPKKGELLDIVDELIHIPKQIVHQNFSLVVLLTREEEVRSADGEGSWRRKGVSIIDRRLLDVVESIEFHHARDYMRLLPDDLPSCFTNAVIADRMNKPKRKIRKLTYVLRQMGLIRMTGKQGNAHIFEPVPW